MNCSEKDSKIYMGLEVWTSGKISSEEVGRSRRL